MSVPFVVLNFYPGLTFYRQDTLNLTTFQNGNFTRQIKAGENEKKEKLCSFKPHFFVSQADWNP